ncbi:hypothetical protein SBRCBS47491_009153 [Sporothrix bragantina]|uniref:Neutral/alkaline non-lysosomal ceramidase N-terminal domain-containing protein n=1 Tax=Sporothrix bragantina TaxID=671064 RepID=A0ABP0CTW6_9PEZI
MRSFSLFSQAAALLSWSVTAAAGDNSSSSGLMVGTARVDITPYPNPHWLPLNEFPHEKLHVRAIVYENNGVRGAFVNCELAFIQDGIYKTANKLVAEALNTSLANVLVSITHAHSAGPAGVTNANLYGNAAVRNYSSLGLAAVEAATLALGNMQPAKVGYNTGEAYFNVNRDALDPLTGRWTQAANLSGPIDREVQVLTFLGLDNTPLASYTSYGMHPVNSYLSGFTTGDWPAAMMRWIETSMSVNDTFVAIFSQQASGDVNPLLRRAGTNNLASISSVPITGFELVQECVEEPVRDGYTPMVRPDDHYIRQLFQELEAQGVMMGEIVMQIMSLTTDYDANPSIWAAQETVSCPGRKRLDNAREGVAGVYTNGPAFNVTTGAVGLGDVVLVTVGGEIFTRIGWRIKNETTMSKTMIVTMTNGQPSGYIPDALSFDQETFQVLGTSLMPGACAELNITNSLISMVASYKATL